MSKRYYRLFLDDILDELENLTKKVLEDEQWKL